MRSSDTSVTIDATRRFRNPRSRQNVTMRRSRSPGECLFVDHAGMTVPLTIDGKKHEAQVLAATMGVSGRLRSATGSRSAAISPATTVRAVLALLDDNAGPDRS